MMDKERTVLIARAADPDTGILKIRAALAVVTGDQLDTPSRGFLSELQALQFAGGIKRSTIWQWRKNGLKSFKVAGRRLYTPDDLTAFITRRAKL